MSLWLAEGVHAVVIDGDAVFLDVGANAYFCLPDIAEHLALEGRKVIASSALADELIGAGFASDQASALVDRQARAPRLSARALLAASPNLAAPIEGRHWRALVGAGLAAGAAMKRPFSEMLPPPHEPAPEPDQAMIADLAVFRRLWPWTPFDGLCLFRSDFLRRYLAWLGHRVDWVFGVRTYPFVAHCWLQAGGVTLEDEADRLLAFHPIMVR